jgi:hypothetical protein
LSLVLSSVYVTTGCSKKKGFWRTSWFRRWGVARVASQSFEPFFWRKLGQARFSAIFARRRQWLKLSSNQTKTTLLRYSFRIVCRLTFQFEASLVGAIFRSQLFYRSLLFYESTQWWHAFAVHHTGPQLKTRGCQTKESDGPLSIVACAGAGMCGACR